MLNIVLFGAPGSGKGTQSELIIAEYGLKHLSTGDILRKEMAEQSEVGKLAKGFIEAGQLVPDEVIIKMLEKQIDLQGSKGVIFDGFPRTVAQAKALKKMLNDLGTDVSVMLSLNVEEQALINRLLKRGEISGRSDDNLETIQKRINVYKEQTLPVADYYKTEEKLVDIEGNGTVEDTFELIKKAIEKL
jgi:adenylate kinase